MTGFLAGVVAGVVAGGIIGLIWGMRIGRARIIKQLIFPNVRTHPIIYEATELRLVDPGDPTTTEAEP